MKARFDLSAIRYSTNRVRTASNFLKFHKYQQFESRTCHWQFKTDQLTFALLSELTVFASRVVMSGSHGDIVVLPVDRT